MSEAKAQLLSVLLEIISQDQTRIKQAEALLKQWENSPNFFATLQDIFCDRSVDEAVRVLCGIYLKNGIDRFWRRSAKNPISPEEKKVIRERLLQFIDEPSKKLTVQNAAIIAKIARLEYPQQWPELLPSLIQSLQTVDLSQAAYARLVHYRILEILNEVLTELASRRLVLGRKQFADIVPTMFQTIVQVYVAYVEQSLSKLSAAATEETLFVELEIVTICIKSLKTLLASGVKDIQSYDEPKRFIDLSLQHLQQYMTCLAGMHFTGQPLKEAIQNIVEEIGALYLAIQKSSPFSCILCPAWIPLLQYYWTHLLQEGAKRPNTNYSSAQQPDAAASSIEPFLLQGMLIIHSTIQSMAYDAEDENMFHLSSQEKSYFVAAQQRLQEQFLTEANVSSLAKCLIRQYMLLTPSDMERWEDDPEGWFIETTTETAADHWEFDLRPCAEKTFTTLLHQYRQLVSPLLLTLIDQVLVVAPVGDQEMWTHVLLKDAVYAAIGLGVKTLYGHFDFERFVMTHMVNELNACTTTTTVTPPTTTMNNVLKRRIAWTLGRWVSESISEDCRKMIFEVLLKLMVPHTTTTAAEGEEKEDLVVRLTAAHALTQAVDNWEFDISLFLPYLGTTMTTLLNLLSQAEESETVLTMINDLKAMIVRTGTEIFPYASDIVQILIPYWNPSSEPLLLSSLIDTFRHIVATVKEESVQLHSLLIPIVKYCIDPANDAHVYLLEDALELWWTLLQTTPVNNNDLMSLYYPPALELLDYDTENLRKILKIIESYILLEPSSTLSARYQPIFFGKLALKVKDAMLGPAAAYLSHTLDLIFQSAPLQVLGEALIQSNLLPILLQLLMEQEKSQAIARYMNLLARLCFYDPHFVITVIQATADPTQQAEVFHRVLDKWLDNFDYLDGHNKKIACMGFTQLVIFGNPLVLNKLPNIMAVWMDAGFDSHDSSGEPSIMDEEEMDLNEVDDCQESQRKKQLAENDQMQQCNLLALINNALNQPHVIERLPQIDPYIVNQVNNLFH